MANVTNSIDTIMQEDKNQYAISPGKNGTLEGYTSNDDLNPTSWDETEIVSASDNNSSIFSKLTSMVKNSRLVHNKIGDTDFSDEDDTATITDTLGNLKNEISNKADISHKHTVATLPVTSNMTNSSDLIPTSALVNSVYSDVWGQLDTMDATLKDIDDKTKDYNTNGYSTDDLGTWSSTDDVDQFLKKYNHSTGYSDGVVTLKLGNTITIKDGTYNAKWMIAGFDVEAKSNVIDGVDYNNGYGIALVPTGTLGSRWWGFNHYTTKGTSINPNIPMFWNWTAYGYALSDIHILLNGITDSDKAYITSHVKTRKNDDHSEFETMINTAGKVKTSLQSILSDHLVERKVLLTGGANGATSVSTTAHVTLMSVHQTEGPGVENVSDYYGTYQDGEANYRLPVFNHTSFNISSNFWLRNYYGTGYACVAAGPKWQSYYGVNIGHTPTYGEYDDPEDQTGDSELGWYVPPACWSSHGIRPMIYIR